MAKIVIGVMGAGEKATERYVAWAFELGAGIAEKGWILLTGGRDAGVMEAASKGAASRGGLVVAILPSPDTKGMSRSVDVAIITDMGSARNNINVLSSDIVIACGATQPGTLSEVALALKAGKHVVLLNDDEDAMRFLARVGGERIHPADSSEAAIRICDKLLHTARRQPLEQPRAVVDRSGEAGI